MLAVRLEKDLEERLAALAHHLRRSKSDLVRDALRRYLDEDSWLADCQRQSRNAVAVSAHDPLDELLEGAAGEVDGWT